MVNLLVAEIKSISMSLAAFDSKMRETAQEINELHLEQYNIYDLSGVSLLTILSKHS